MSRHEPRLFTNAVIHTVDERRPIATWFTVLGDRFQRVGAGESPPARQVVDLGGRCVVPGFIDAHTHFFQTGLDALHIDLSGARTLDEVAERLVAGAPPGKRTPVFASGFEEDALIDGRPMTREDLDRVFADRPVWVNRVDYHSAVVSTAALRRLGVPAGTRGLMRAADGQPTGVLRGEAYFHAKLRSMQWITLDVKERALKAAVGAMVPRGVTAVAALEGGPLFGDEGIHFVLQHIDRLPLDVTLFIQEKKPLYARRLGFRHVGGCILIDGSIGSYTAALDEPYEGSKRNRGILYETKRSLWSFVREVHAARGQLAFHAIGPRAIEVLLGLYEQLLDREPHHDHRHRIEHFELATDDQIQRAAELGLVLCMQPAFEWLWGGPSGMYASRLGERWRRTNRLRTILAAGLRVAGSSDASVTPPDPLLGIHAAVNHPNEDERIDARAALAMMTIEAAYSTFHDRVRGSISPGKEASFVVLGEDLLAAPGDRLKDIPVLETWSRGRRVYEAGPATRRRRGVEDLVSSSG